MFLELNLKNFVLIKEASLSFSPGLTILTGETGAGKTLLVMALKFVLGARANSQHIRTGSDNAMVQAVFDIPPVVQEKLEELDIPCDEDLVIRRTINKDGKSRNYINGVIVSLQNIREIASILISIAGQHQYQELLRPEKHRLALDAFAGLNGEVEEVEGLYKKLMALQSKYKAHVQKAKKSEEEIKKLGQTAREIDALSPKPGEDEDLQKEKTILKESSALKSSGSFCYKTLYGGKGSVIELVSSCSQELEKMQAIDPEFKKELSELETISCIAQEIAETMRDYVGRIPSDVSRLDDIEERIYHLRGLMRKYGPEIDDVIAYRKSLDEKINAVKMNEKDIEDLKEEIKSTETAFLERSKALSKKRHTSSSILSKEVSRELTDLKLLKAGFRVEVKTPANIDLDSASLYGIDSVHFLFRPNVGEPFKPIDSIASGGELSRVMLALRTALARKSHIDTVVFDEIDSGLSGEVAERVGEKLKNLSQTGQVIAITHFPQIAALSDEHMTVEKKAAQDETISSIRKIKEEDRKEELARMLGGGKDAALEYAGNLLNRSRDS